MSHPYLSQVPKKAVGVDGAGGAGREQVADAGSAGRGGAVKADGTGGAGRERGIAALGVTEVCWNPG